MAIRQDLVLANGVAISSRSLREFVDYCKDTGRGVVVSFGDSTTRRGGSGWQYALQQSLCQYAPISGLIFPFNHKASYNENFNGMYGCRRRANASSFDGTDGDSGATLAIPSGWNDYYFNLTAANGWEGPVPSYYARTTLTADPGAGGTTLNVADTTYFPSSGRVRIENECILYSGKTATTFTGCTRANLTNPPGGGGLVAAAAHAIGTVVAAMENGDNMVNIKNGIMNANSAKYVAMWYHPEGATVSTANTVLAYGTIDTFDQTATVNHRNILSGINTTGTDSITNTAKYTVRSVAAATTLDDLGIAVGPTGHNTTGTSTSNGNGPFGPGFCQYFGLTEQNNPYGLVYAHGVSQGGKTLNEMLEVIMNPTRGQNALKEMFIQYMSVRNSDLGGNTNGALLISNYWGHNEGVNNAKTGFCQTDQSWSYQTDSTVVLADVGGINNSTTTINVTNASQLNSGGGHILIGTERIKYTGYTGTLLSGVSRGWAGTTAASHAQGDRVYGGYAICNPLGLAADMYYWYTLCKTAFLANATTCLEKDLYFMYTRPLCMSDSPAEIADNTVTSTNANKEYKFKRYADVLCSILKPLIPGFIFVDPSLYFTKTQLGAFGWDNDSTDLVHNTLSAYCTSMNHAVAAHMYGYGSRSRQLG